MGKRPPTLPTGMLAPYGAEFRRQLLASGYSRSAAKKQYNLMVHLDAWLGRQELGLAALASGQVEEFFLARRESGRANLLTRRSVAPLVSFLQQAGALAVQGGQSATGPADALVESFGAYLRTERGLVEGTVRFYLRVARRFLMASFPAGAVEARSLSASHVTGFLTRECRRLSVSSARQTLSSLRSFLRFLRMEGLTVLALDQAVLPVAGWAQSLPRGVEPAQVASLLASCDRRSGTGRRDYAILMVLTDLGLRAGEVVAMELDDIDWRGGQLLVRGKGRRLDALPLTPGAGAAIAGYLRRGRPASNDRHVFLRHLAPHVGLEGSGAVRSVLERACRRAGVSYVNPHRLRHSLATAMLRGGASLREIAAVLRQNGTTVTATYAKVDHDRLAALALEWPEVAR
jgi:integrase/recombinase XerD